ncbi:MAG: TRAP transporter small permease [gamma proteobacterium endosymbiont of Lamellibrachia anaximandri]|nr:TRAP transporter small permease [gamma proteobacterium endosymbiont of Lamellibrachia anaximandri]MBL3617645.1 TRAP transporter small permease [gamma proteobacterium endosymbiont of Lamellibrachia anaximandri]
MEVKLKRVREFILLAEDGVMALLLTAMILLAVAQILLRNFFDSGIIWADPTLRMLVLWIGLMGAIASTREDRHIRIDLLSRYLSGSRRNFIQAVTDLFSAVVCGLIAWHAARFVAFEYEDGSLLFGSFPAWAGESIIPIGFGIMTLRFLFNIPLRFLPGGKQ